MVSLPIISILFKWLSYAELFHGEDAIAELWVLVQLLYNLGC
jgi:hypothetical protein